ncbi:MAG: hypothetical protein CBD58_03595 [bacterium TMED198]|nr:MAG: hypothetical protein CBD58_03595 [bacterium TMED198]
MVGPYRYSISDNSFIELNNEVDARNVLSMLHSESGDLWVSTGYPVPSVQVFRNNKLLKSIENLDVDKISSLTIGASNAFAVYEQGDNKGILEFDLDQGLIPDYRDYYSSQSISNQVSEIFRVFIDDNFLYIVTDKGLYKSSLGQNKKLQSSWELVFASASLLDGISIYNKIFLLTSDKILSIYNDDSFDQVDVSFEVLKFKKSNNILLAYSQSEVVSISEDLLINELFSIDFSDISTYLISIDVAPNGDVYGYFSQFGLVNLSQRKFYSPSSILPGNVSAVYSSKSNQFIFKTDLGLHINDNGEYFNLYQQAKEKYIPLNSSLDQISINSKSLDYSDNNFSNNLSRIIYGSSYSDVSSIIVNRNGNIMFSMEDVCSYCDESGEISSAHGAVVEVIGLDETKRYRSIATSFMDANNYCYGGVIGLSEDNIMSVSQLNKDSNGNIWAVQKESSTYRYVAAVQNKNEILDWRHITSNKLSELYTYNRNSTGYFDHPTEVSFKGNYAWIGFEFRENSSSGGIGVVDYSMLWNDYTDNCVEWEDESNNWIWLNNQDLLPGADYGCTACPYPTVLSLAFDEDGLLWVLTPGGVRAFYPTTSYNYEVGKLEFGLTPIGLTYFSNLSLEYGDKLRVDPQNNKWLVSKNHGIFVVLNDFNLWPTNEGLNIENSFLLSNKVNDLAFDNSSSKAYIATDLGISILDIPFGSDKKSENLSISPNPFIVSEDDGLTINKISSGSVVKILTLNGTLVNEFKLSEHESSLLFWNGKTKDGSTIQTGVYLVSVYHPLNGTAVTKLAVINK